jgi:hypothetical protein
MVRLAESSRYGQRHGSHASGSACGAIETEYSLCLKIVYLSSCIMNNTVSLNGTRENGWLGHVTINAPSSCRSAVHVKLQHGSLCSKNGIRVQEIRAPRLAHQHLAFGGTSSCSHQWLVGAALRCGETQLTPQFMAPVDWLALLTTKNNRSPCYSYPPSILTHSLAHNFVLLLRQLKPHRRIVV